MSKNKITIRQYLQETKNLSKKEIEKIFLSRQIYFKNEAIINLDLKINKNEANDIYIKRGKEYVSRGAYKLLGAFSLFDINIQNKVCLDIGSSTGGFSQVLLEKGAKLVYALDVGTNQLDYSLRQNKKIVSLEQTNVKNISKNTFNEKIEFVTCDVSFISLKIVIKKLIDILDAGVECILLIKPQFEAPKKDVLEGGFVLEEKHEGIIEKLKNEVKDFFEIKDIKKSPITGNKSKNIEYLFWIKKN